MGIWERFSIAFFGLLGFLSAPNKQRKSTTGNDHDKLLFSLQRLLGSTMLSHCCYRCKHIPILHRTVWRWAAQTRARQGEMVLFCAPVGTTVNLRTAELRDRSFSFPCLFISGILWLLFSRRTKALTSNCYWWALSWVIHIVSEWKCSNSLIIHTPLTQPEQRILVRGMGLETQWKTSWKHGRAFISFLVFETPMKHSHSFLKYYFKQDCVL